MNKQQKFQQSVSIQKSVYSNLICLVARSSSTGFNCRLFWVGSWAGVPFSVLKGIGVLGWWFMDTFLLTESCILRVSQVCLQSQVFGVKIISKLAAMAARTNFRCFLRSTICFLLYSYHLIFLCLSHNSLSCIHDDSM